jgi:hypothetical protein
VDSQERSRKGGGAAYEKEAPAARQEWHSKGGQASNANLTREQRQESARKAAATRRRNGTHRLVGSTSRDWWAQFTPEERSQMMRRNQAKVSPEVRKARGMAAWRGTTPEQRSEISRQRYARRKPVAFTDRVCAHCDGMFTPGTHDQKYCCHECGRAADNILRRYRRGR